MLKAIAGLILASVVASATAADTSRTTLLLDGTWQVAEGTNDVPPAVFTSTMLVPGLVTQAVPALDTNAAESVRQSTFWLRRSFTLPAALPEVAFLRLGQALYGFKVRVNGRAVTLPPSITAMGQVPVAFDIRPYLKPGTNELCIAVNTMGGMPSDRRRNHLQEMLPVSGKIGVGWDFEKRSYIPGITDSVELTLAQTPFIRLTQVVSELSGVTPAARVHVWLQGVPAGKSPVTVAIRESKSGKTVGSAMVEAEGDAQGNAQVVAQIELPAGHLWTPEDPFLYSARITTDKDSCETRFGLRTFTFDPKTKRAILNGKPYFMRGTNYCLQRFMEDSECARLPWDRTWVRNLHKQAKTMNWNSIRYCVGLMPAFWYDIADEEGFLIQDEYPLWTSVKPFDGTTDALEKDYRSMMEAHWNHPSVVLWDSCNETNIKETGEALARVRALDLSNRPWDNGWGPAALPTDSLESHPYAYPSGGGLGWLETERHTPYTLGSDWRGHTGYGRNAVVANEYAGLWLTREGVPCLSIVHYDKIIPRAKATPAIYRRIYAQDLSAETEFWRHARTQAAVMEFCSLGYSRADGQTGDHFLAGRVAELKLDPEFEKRARDAFAPVGVMLQFRKATLTCGQTHTLSVSLINDLEQPWQGTVALRLTRDGRVLKEWTKEGALAPQGTASVSFENIEPPESSGPCELSAEIKGHDGKIVRSVRDIALTPPAKASSTAGAGFAAECAFDGDDASRWAAAPRDNQWLQLDLLAKKTISRVELDWETAFDLEYAIEVSDDATTWTRVYHTANGKGGREVVEFPEVAARYVRFYSIKRSTSFGPSLWELKVGNP